MIKNGSDLEKNPSLLLKLLAEKVTIKLSLVLATTSP